MNKSRPKNITHIELAISKFTQWVGSVSSIVVHTVLFILAFVAIYFGAALDTVLLVLTTAVSLEAIYLALFIQMTVNRNTASLENVEVDIDEIERDIDEIERDVDEMERDIDKIEAHDSKEHVKDQQIEEALKKIQDDLAALAKHIDSQKK